MKHTFNFVRVSVDTYRKVYRLSFEKHFTIISNDKPKWYKGQFYCNRYLGNSEHTRKYYSEHPPSWEQLKVFANMKYRCPNSASYSNPIKLKVIPITDCSYYIPFHIHYESTSGSKISMEKGTRVILNYGYEVSAELWGSYLNRTLSFFGEKSKIVFQYPNEEVENEYIEVSLHRLSHFDGAPERMRKCDVTSMQDNQTIYEIDLPRGSFAKFRVWWDSEALLGINKTVNSADDSHMTDY